MINFKSHTITEAASSKNTHMTHIEDRVIYGGVNGARDAILALRAMRDMLAGSSKKTTDVTVKWDGAPAVFAGIDPTDKKFFVAKKGIFNKNPKVYKSHAEIDADTSGDLSTKLKVAFDELSKIGITGVVQGDLMFTKDDLKTETIDGVKYITFHPNTIVYAVRADSAEAQLIRKAKIGIVVHTSYSGDSFENMRATFNVKSSTFKKNASVWLQDANLRDLSGTATLTQKDTDEVTKALSVAGTIFKRIKGTALNDLSKNQELAGLIETYNNSFVRRGEKVTNTSKHVDGLIKWIEERFAKEASKVKTQTAKDRKFAKRDELLKFFSPGNKANLKAIFDLQNAIVVAKLVIINKLNKVNKIDTFIKKRDGYHVTGVEGFVAIDKLKGGAVKLVDRMTFSYNNFSSDVIKGWDTPSRS